MLKCYARGDNDGVPYQIIMLGLSHENLARLKDRKPIDIDGTEIGLRAGTRIVIFSGETEQSMARELESLIGADTNLVMDPGLKD